MGTKSATVTARIEPEVKEEAEKIIAELGFSVSAVINSLYKQIILKKGIPYELNILTTLKTETMIPQVESEMSKEEFDAMLLKGLSQALNGESFPCDELFGKGLRKNERMKLILYEVNITPFAKLQIEQIRDYIVSKLSMPELEQDMLSTIRKIGGSLSLIPDDGQLVEGAQWKEYKVLEITENNYAVYYWINKKDYKVHVIAVTYVLNEIIGKKIP